MNENIDVKKIRYLILCKKHFDCEKMTTAEIVEMQELGKYLNGDALLPNREFPFEEFMEVEKKHTRIEAKIKTRMFYESDKERYVEKLFKLIRDYYYWIENNQITLRDLRDYNQSEDYFKLFIKDQEERYKNYLTDLM